MKNPSTSVLVWWKSRNPKRSAVAKRLMGGYGIHELVPACHAGTISAFEQAKIKGALKEIFCRSTDRYFMAPICTSCHRRFIEMNTLETKCEPDFELL